MERVMSALNRAVNSNAAINALLACTFGVLAVRSKVQQQAIEAMEAEKDALVKTNKAMTKTIWDWKQKLYAEAESNPQNALVPLSTLKSIYGEAATATSPALSDASGDDKQAGKSPAPNFMV